MEENHHLIQNLRVPCAEAAIDDPIQRRGLLGVVVRRGQGVRGEALLHVLREHRTDILFDRSLHVAHRDAVLLQLALQGVPLSESRPGPGAEHIPTWRGGKLGCLGLERC